MPLNETIEQMRMSGGWDGNSSEAIERYHNLQQLRGLNSLGEMMYKDKQLYNVAYPKKAYDVPDVAIDPSYGKSKYDIQAKNSLMDLQNLNDYRAKSQPWYSKMFSGIGKAGSMAATTGLFLLNAATTSIEAMFNKNDKEMEMFNGENNTWFNRWMFTMNNSYVQQQLVDDVNTRMDEVLPNYRTQKEQETDWYKKIVGPGMINFWFDDILKNIGFSFGSLAGAKVLTKGLSLGSRAIGNTERAIARGLSRGEVSLEKQLARTSTRKLYQRLGVTGTADEVAEILTKNGNLTDEARQILDVLKKREVRDNIFRQVSGSFLGAAGEAQFEAHNTQKEFIEEQVSLLDKWFQNNDDKLYKNYKQEMEETGDTETSFEDYKTKLYNDAIKKIELTSYHAAHDVFWYETAVLSVSNFMTFRRFFNSGWSSHSIGRAFGRNAGDIADDGIIKRKIRFFRDKATNKITRTESKSFAFDRLNAVSGMLTEGGEEMAQRYIASLNKAQGAETLNQWFAQHCDDKYNKKYLDETGKYISAYRYAANNTFLTAEGWEEGFAGLVLGLIGLPRAAFNSSKMLSSQSEKGKNKGMKIPFTNKRFNLPFDFTWDTGVFAEMREVHNTEKLVKEAVAKANSVLQNEQEQERIHNLALDAAINQQFTESVLRGDRSAFKNAELDELLLLIHMFDTMDARSIINDILDGIGKTEEGHVKEWLQSEENKQKLKEEDRNISEEEFYSRVMKEYGAMKKTIESYNKYRKSVDGFLGDKIEDKYKHSIASAAVIAEDRLNRVIEMLDELAQDDPAFAEAARSAKEKNGNITAKTFQALDRALGGDGIYTKENKNNKKGLNWLINGLVEVTSDIINKNGDLGEEELNVLIDNAASDFIKDFITTNTSINIDVIKMQTVFDVIDNLLAHLERTADFKYLLMNPTELQIIENAFKQQAEEEAPAEPDIDPEAQFATGKRTTSTNNPFNKEPIDVVNSVETAKDEFFKRLRPNNPILEFPEFRDAVDKVEAAQTAEEIEKAFAELTDLLNDAIDNNSDNKWREGAEIMKSDIIASRRASYVPKGGNGKAVEAINTALDRISEVIDTRKKLKFRGRFDKERGSFVNDIYRAEINGKQLTLTLEQDCISNETYFLVSIGNAKAKYIINRKFDVGKRNIIPTDNKALPSDIYVEAKNVREKLQEKFAGILSEDDLSALISEFNNIFSVENGILKIHYNIKNGSVDDPFVKTIFLPFGSIDPEGEVHESSDNIKGRAEIREIVDDLQKQLKEIAGVEEEAEPEVEPEAEPAPSPEPENEGEGEVVEEGEGPTEESEEGETPPTEEGREEGAGTELEPVEEEKEEEQPTRPQEEPEEEPQEEPEEEPAAEPEDESNEEPQPEKETILSEDEEPEFDDTTSLYNAIKERFFINDENDPNKFSKNSASLIPFTLYDTYNIQDTDAFKKYHHGNKTKRSQLYLRFLKESAKEGNNYTILANKVVETCIDLGIYEFHNTRSLEDSTKIRFRVPTAIQYDFAFKNLIEATAVVDGEERIVGFIPSKSNLFKTITDSGIDPKTGYYIKTGYTTGFFGNGGTVEVSDDDKNNKTLSKNDVVLKQWGKSNTYRFCYRTKRNQKNKAAIHFYNGKQHPEKEQNISDEFLDEHGVVYLVTSRKGDMKNASEKTDYTIRKVQPTKWDENDKPEILRFSQHIIDECKRAYNSLFKTDDQGNVIAGEVKDEIWEKYLKKLNIILRDNFAFYTTPYHDSAKSETSAEGVTGKFEITEYKNKYYLRAKNASSDKILTYNIEGNDGKTHNKYIDILIYDANKNVEANPNDIFNFIMTGATSKLGLEHSYPVHSLNDNVFNGNGTRLDGTSGLNIRELIEQNKIRVMSELIPYNVSPKFELSNAGNTIVGNGEVSLSEYLFGKTNDKETTTTQENVEAEQENTQNEPPQEETNTPNEEETNTPKKEEVTTKKKSTNNRARKTIKKQIDKKSNTEKIGNCPRI